MKVSGFWSLAGLIAIGLIIGDLVKNGTGTAEAFSGATALESSVGNQLLGNPAPTTTTTTGKKG